LVFICHFSPVARANRFSHYRHYCQVTRIKVTFDRPGRFIWRSLINEEAMRPFYVGKMPSEEQSNEVVATIRNGRIQSDGQKQNKRKQAKKGEMKMKEDHDEDDERRILRASSIRGRVL